MVYTPKSSSTSFEDIERPGIDDEDSQENIEPEPSRVVPSRRPDSVVIEVLDPEPNVERSVREWLKKSTKALELSVHTLSKPSCTAPTASTSLNRLGICHEYRKKSQEVTRSGLPFSLLSEAPASVVLKSSSEAAKEDDANSSQPQNRRRPSLRRMQQTVDSRQSEMFTTCIHSGSYKTDQSQPAWKAFREALYKLEAQDNCARMSPSMGGMHSVRGEGFCLEFYIDHQLLPGKKRYIAILRYDLIGGEDWAQSNQNLLRVFVRRYRQRENESSVEFQQACAEYMARAVKDLQGKDLHELSKWRAAQKLDQRKDDERDQE